MTNLPNVNSGKESSKKEIKDIRVVFLIFGGIFSVIGYKVYPNPLAYLWFTVAVGLVVTLAITPMVLKPLFNMWIKLALVVGKFNTMVLLTVMFFLVFLPMGLLMRLFGKDPMSRDCYKGASSYWITSSLSGLEDKSRYERQF